MMIRSPTCSVTSSSDRVHGYLGFLLQLCMCPTFAGIYKEMIPIRSSKVIEVLATCRSRLLDLDLIFFFKNIRGSQELYALLRVRSREKVCIKPKEEEILFFSLPLSLDLSFLFGMWNKALIHTKMIASMWILYGSPPYLPAQHRAISPASSAQ